MSKEFTALQHNSGLAEGIQRVVDLAAKPKVSKFHTDEEKEYFLLEPGAGQPAVVIGYERLAPDCKRTLHTRESFEAYVKKHHNPATVCFVDNNHVLAEFDPTALRKHTAELPLKYHEQFAAVLILGKPMRQKDLWRHLSTLLVDNLPATLLAMVNDLKVADTTNADVQIDATGLGRTSGARDVTVNFKNKAGQGEAKEIPVDWTYTGPVFDCTDSVAKLSLRMELSVPETRGALFFTFHPIGLENLLRESRTKLRKELEEGLKPLEIYDGI